MKLCSNSFLRFGFGLFFWGGGGRVLVFLGCGFFFFFGLICSLRPLKKPEISKVCLA